MSEKNNVKLGPTASIFSDPESNFFILAGQVKAKPAKMSNTFHAHIRAGGLVLTDEDVTEGTPEGTAQTAGNGGEGGTGGSEGGEDDELLKLQQESFLELLEKQPTVAQLEGFCSDNELETPKAGKKDELIEAIKALLKL